MIELSDDKWERHVHKLQGELVMFAARNRISAGWMASWRPLR
jgi:hypothetical protein